jgi:hypothetical protein
MSASEGGRRLAFELTGCDDEDAVWLRVGSGLDSNGDAIGGRATRVDLPHRSLLRIHPDHARVLARGQDRRPDMLVDPLHARGGIGRVADDAANEASAERRSTQVVELCQ